MDGEREGATVEGLAPIMETTALLAICFGLCETSKQRARRRDPHAQKEKDDQTSKPRLRAASAASRRPVTPRALKIAVASIRIVDSLYPRALAISRLGIP